MLDDSVPEETVRLGDFDSHGTSRALVRGRRIEVEQGIPGEVVRIAVSGKRRPRGHIIEVLTAAPDRVEPPCPYFREWACGGCQWQHIAYESQVERKRQAVDAVMASTGMDLYVEAAYTPEDPWRYRTTAGIALGKRAGFRRQASLAIVPIRDCPISHQAIGRLMAILNESLEAGRLPDFHGRVRVEVRLVEAEEGAGLLALIQPDARLPAPMEELESLAESLAGINEVVGISIRRTTGSVDTLWGESEGRVQLGGRSLILNAAAFFQTNLAMVEELLPRLREAAGPLNGQRIADVYGGVGLFGLFLADAARHVTVIESNPAAVDAGILTANEWGLTNVDFRCEPAEIGLEKLERVKLVIVDPPRSGLSRRVVDRLSTLRPRTILYVSCLAESLARDLTALAACGYRCESLELFDFYPQTYHVELLAVIRLDS